MKTYYVQLTWTATHDIDVQAESQEEAVAIAEREFQADIDLDLEVECFVPGEQDPDEEAVHYPPDMLQHQIDEQRRRIAKYGLLTRAGYQPPPSLKPAQEPTPEQQAKLQKIVQLIAHPQPTPGHWQTQPDGKLTWIDPVL